MATRAWRPDLDESIDRGMIKLLAWLAIAAVFVYSFAIYGFIHAMNVLINKLEALIH